MDFYHKCEAIRCTFRPMGHKKPPRIHPDLAIALRYEAGQGNAPRVVASGQGLMARRMEQIAQENHIPVHQDEALAQALGKVEVNQTIPDELFEAVARVLAFVWRVDHRMGKQIHNS